jgi:hypothetical protein
MIRPPLKAQRLTGHFIKIIDLILFSPWRLSPTSPGRANDETRKSLA